MRCQWTVRRTMRPAPEGQHRWDRAYQEVLAWMEELADVSRGPRAPEASHEGGGLCSRCLIACSVSSHSLSPLLGLGLDSAGLGVVFAV